MGARICTTCRAPRGSRVPAVLCPPHFLLSEEGGEQRDSQLCPLGCPQTQGPALPGLPLQKEQASHPCPSLGSRVKGAPEQTCVTGKLLHNAARAAAFQPSTRSRPWFGGSFLPVPLSFQES
ncbi:hypothetical protein VULLAG_LOCUS17837 [Vulpes lagopus]